MRLKSTRRYYARRLACPHIRRCQIGFRVSEGVRQLLEQMACARHMSVSEYMARLLNDHVISQLKGRT